MSALINYPRPNRPRGVFYPAAFIFFLVFIVCATPLPAQRTNNNPSALTARLINLEAAAKETFRYNASLHNGNNRSGIYALQADVPQGWNVAFRVEGMQVTSVRLDSNKTQAISIEITPGPSVKPGKYQVPVNAVSDVDNLRLDLEAVVKGSYGIELTTPSGRLSDEITEGSTKSIQLTIRNTGTLPLDALDLTAQAPSQWKASFDPAKIERLEAGGSMEVVAQLQVPDKTIAGDYLTTFTVKNSGATANAAFRMTVTTSWLAGWFGVLIIFIAVGIVYYLIRKYGRR